MQEYSLPQALNATLLPSLCRIAEEAGYILMRHWRTDQEVTIKDDESPVTQADIDADAFIVGELRKLMPGMMVVSERGW